MDGVLYRNDDILLQTLFQHLLLVASRLLSVPNVIGIAVQLHYCHVLWGERSCKLELRGALMHIAHHGFTVTQNRSGQHTLEQPWELRIIMHIAECSRGRYTGEMQGRSAHPQGARNQPTTPSCAHW